jgi:aminoglycoside phosphotransferase (APT) family kinase protein
MTDLAQAEDDPTFSGLISDPERLQAWFNGVLGEARGPARLIRMKGGASNILFRVESGDCVYALRRPPRASNDPTANNMAREVRLLEALRGTDVRHSRLVGSSLDPDIIGAPFVLMAWVDGFTPWDPMPEPFASDAAVRRTMGFEVVDALTDVANVDWQAVGLEGFGKPDTFLERQVDRWNAQLDRYRTREIPHLTAVAEWLRSNTPPTQRIGLMHGDYSFANVMFASTVPARLAAIVDWESATIGDPLLDLGHLLGGWEDDQSGPVWANFTDCRLGFPSRAEIAARYAERTGLSVDRLDFYMTLALFKLGIIMEGAYARYASGKSQLPQHKAMETTVPAMIAQAARVAGLA